ncbi:MAG: exodeoxyribonuclease VII large subunit [Gemmatales bacterium]|nr:exodeoxyribonuclease VII large subunit [Gemmatales bacterium]
MSKQVPALTVSQLTALIRELLEDAFDNVWVCGEISNCKQYTSGHVYFTLKDEGAQIRCVMWRDVAARVRFGVEDGLQVLVRGRVSVYPQRGDYQLYVREMQPRGLGPLELAFRQLYEKLQKLGWFDPARKRPLPRVPQRIGIITSPRGAVIRDMLRILGRRWPLAEVWVRPVTVQGESAPREIAEALRLFSQLACVDVVIVARGGGSAEDLWAFNEELVAAAIRQCSDRGLPVISAVGHEVDWTIADYVADWRAATPSEAAEKVVPDQVQMRQNLRNLRIRLAQALLGKVRAARRQLESLARRRVLKQPLERLRVLSQELDEWGERLDRGVRRYLDDKRQLLAHVSARLQALSPLQVLARGFSLTWKEETAALVRRASDVAVGDTVITQLARGRLRSRVETIFQDGEATP